MKGACARETVSKWVHTVANTVQQQLQHGHDVHDAGHCRHCMTMPLEWKCLSGSQWSKQGEQPRAQSKLRSNQRQLFVSVLITNLLKPQAL